MAISPRYTSADLELLPDVEGVRYEIIDGELYVTRQPHAGHQYTTSAFVSELRQWSMQSGAGVAMVAPGLVFAADNDVAPDVVWVSMQRLRNVLDDAGHFRAAPEIVVEVLSPGVIYEPASFPLHEDNGVAVIGRMLKWMKKEPVLIAHLFVR